MVTDTKWSGFIGQTTIDTADTLAFLTTSESAINNRKVLVSDFISSLGLLANATLPDNWVVINSEADFNPSGGVITLLGTKIYILGANVSTANRFVVGDGATITGMSIQGSLLTYTGTSVMFTGTDSSSFINAIKITSPNASETFNFTDTVGGVKGFTLNDVQILSTPKIGTFDDMQAVVIDNIAVQNGDNGISIDGTNTFAIEINGMGVISTSATFVGVDFGTSVQSSVTVNSLLVIAPSGAIGIKGAAASANMATGAIGQVMNTSFLGGMTAFLSGIAQDDFRWEFDGNANIPNSIDDVLLSLTGGSTETVISTINTPVKLAGTFVVENCSHFTCDTTGKATFLSERGSRLPVDVSFSVEPASGNNKLITLYLAINGSVISNSGRQIKIDNADPQEVSIHWQYDFTNGDFAEAYLENNTDTVNIIASSGELRIR